MLAMSQTVLYVSGCTTDGLHTVPICEYDTLHHTILRVAGRDLTEFLMKNLTDRGCSFTASAEREIARDISEKLWYIGVVTTQSSSRLTGRRPASSQTETSSAKRFRFAEELLQQNFSRLIHDTSFLTKCDVDTRKKLCANVVLSGGTALFQVTIERMTKEPTALFTMNFTVVAPTECRGSQTDPQERISERFVNRVDIRKNLYANVVSSTRRRPSSSQTQTSSLSTLNVSSALR